MSALKRKLPTFTALQWPGLNARVLWPLCEINLYYSSGFMCQQAVQFAQFAKLILLKGEVRLLRLFFKEHESCV